MNLSFKQTFDILGKPERKIIGLMSGTSLDGLDIALCNVSGFGKQTKVEVLKFETAPYPEDFTEALRKIFCKKTVDLELLTVLHSQIGLMHAEMVLRCLNRWGISTETVDVIASHGQTIYHAPKNLHPDGKYPNATLQIGDADHIAVKTGILTVSDFRQKHVAFGGEGAPLAVYGDYLLLSSSDENRVLLNLGGISNFTYLPKSLNPAEVFATDVGPANTLIDWCVNTYFNKPFDESGYIASSGKVNVQLLNELEAHPFLKTAMPKSTGQEVFNAQFVLSALEKTGLQSISPADLTTTLSQFTVNTVVNAILSIQQDVTVYVSGGGALNNYMMEQLRAKFPYTIKDTSALNINPKAKEAILFAVLANEMLVGSPLQIGNMPPLTMGKLSFPY